MRSEQLILRSYYCYFIITLLVYSNAYGPCQAKKVRSNVHDGSRPTQQLCVRKPDSQFLQKRILNQNFSIYKLGGVFFPERASARHVTSTMLATSQRTTYPWCMQELLLACQSSSSIVPACMLLSFNSSNS